MRTKILKLILVFNLIVTLSMTDLLVLGFNISVALSESFENRQVTTDEGNIDFDAYFEDENGNKSINFDKEINKESLFLHLKINVKKQGYFNGQINIKNANFSVGKCESNYVKSIQNEIIYLNQITAGTIADFKVKLDLPNDEKFDLQLLSKECDVEIYGKYIYSINDIQSEKTVSATRKIKLNIVENNDENSILNNVSILTNKIVKVDGEEKRLIQYNWNIGLIENNYPVKTIDLTVELPNVVGNQPEIQKVLQLNNMVTYNYNVEDSSLKLTLNNDIESESHVRWVKDGYENIIVTCLYDKDVEFINNQVKFNEKIILYNLKEINSENEIVLTSEEKDNVIEVFSKDMEETIYKGKINSGIERQYVSKTTIKINCAKVVNDISVKEEQTKFLINEVKENANVIYSKISFKKEQFKNLFGEEGVLTVFNENGEEIAKITNDNIISEQSDNENIVIDFKEKNPNGIEIKTTKPIKEGQITFGQLKIIKNTDKQIIQNANELVTDVKVNYNNENSELYSKGIQKEIVKEINLENSTTEAKLEINKETLSTIVTNNVEIKAVLESNNEKYDLYKNPHIEITLPEQVEGIKINSINLIYENELKIRDYNVNDRTIEVNLEGEQTQYKEAAIEGANIVINADLVLNRKASSKNEQIMMLYTNENASSTMNTRRATNTMIDSQEVSIVAPKEVITLNSVRELNVETIGEEEIKEVSLQRGKEEVQLEPEIEIINNDEDSLRNVVILGGFPTNTSMNNMNIEILEGITLEGVENAKVYYTENENATIELTNIDNGWQESVESYASINKYLIVIDDEVEVQASIKAKYKIKIPQNLEYNQNSQMGYTIQYTNSEMTENKQLAATTIKLQTGVGPQAETKIFATVCGKEIDGTVKNGEVIKYKIEVSNVGTEDISNLKVNGQVPEGTTLVTLDDNYIYQESELTTYEDTVQMLKVGEVIYKEYEVRVNNETENNKKLLNNSQINYGDVIKKSETIACDVQKGNLKVTLSRLTSKNIELYEGGIVKYQAIVENISDEKQQNIKINTNIQEGLEISSMQLMTTGELPQYIDYEDEINIGDLESGEIKALRYIVEIKDAKKIDGIINFYLTAEDEQLEYKSNNLQEKVNSFEIQISMATNTESQYVKAGDEIEYIISVKNTGNSNSLGLVVKDEIPKQLTVKEITIDDKEIKITGDNSIGIYYQVDAMSTMIIKIKTIVNYSLAREEAEAITNVAYAEVNGELVAYTSSLTHIILVEEQDNSADEETSENEDGEQDSNNTNESENNKEENIYENDSISRANKVISGMAWYDENANGKKENNEKVCANVKVRLLNATTNELVKNKSGEFLEAITNENGIYILDNIPSGKYIAVFEYETDKYTLTKYKVGDASESENSNVMLKELTIENETNKFASTDIIEIENNNISDINIGLIELKKFDLKLNKYVNRVLIQNASGTTVKTYDNSTLSKVELDAKTLNGTTVIIEYNIVVTNIGELEGYAKKIVDYMPNSLKFSSELNKDWYQSGEYLYNTSISNDKILPGNSIEIKLLLTKSMTGEDTGLINNRAEIAEAYNELETEDINSVPGNNKKGENDLGEANVILSIKTGGIFYIFIAINVLIILIILVIVIINRRKLFKENL